jgi:triosephosphate isomerase (TIM)
MLTEAHRQLTMGFSSDTILHYFFISGLKHMRKLIVAGNWKMHGSKSFVLDLLSALKKGAEDLSQVELVVFPPYPYLDQARELLLGSEIVLGAQNVYSEIEGPYTGEISPLMLKEFDCRYVIVGHSERRHILGEKNDEIVAKFILAGKCGLKPVFCCGETREQREAGQTFAVVTQQLLPLIHHKDAVALLPEAVLAYEPVWAIGTGLTATPEQAQAVHAYIRKEVANIDKSLAEKLRILYGGSVKQSNAAALFSMPDVDGGLIGGASLDVNEFLEIARSCRYYSS